MSLLQSVKTTVFSMLLSTTPAHADVKVLPGACAGKKTKRKTIFLKQHLNVFEQNIALYGAGGGENNLFFFGRKGSIFFHYKRYLLITEISQIQKNRRKKNSHKSIILIYNFPVAPLFFWTVHRFFYIILITQKPINIEECPQVIGNHQRLPKLRDEIFRFKT